MNIEIAALEPFKAKCEAQALQLGVSEEKNRTLQAELDAFIRKLPLKERSIETFKTQRDELQSQLDTYKVKLKEQYKINQEKNGLLKKTQRNVEKQEQRCKEQTTQNEQLQETLNTLKGSLK